MPSDKHKDKKGSKKDPKPENVDENEEENQKKGCMPKKKKEENVGVVPLSQLFRYASGKDRAFLFLGCFAGFANGAVFPLMSLIFGQTFDSFNLGTYSAILNSVKEQATWFVILGLFMLIVQYGMTAFLKIAAEAQIRRIRRDYLAAILRQEQGWYDKQGGVGALTARLTGDTAKMAEGMGEKIGVIFRSYATLVIAFGVGLYKGWQLALVILSCSPVLAGAAAALTTMVASSGSKGQQKYADAGAVATENISAIRTVAAFNAEQKAIDDYAALLVAARKAGIKKGIFAGLGLGVTMALMFIMYSLGLWYGGQLIKDEGWTAGRVMTVFFCIIMGAFQAGAGSPAQSALRTAQGAAFVCFQTLDRVSKIDPTSPKGKKIKEVKGLIEFRDVNFAYPTRQNNPVFKNVNITIQPGQKIAFVGPSGAGKSTAVSLIQRFYDPDSGQVLLDGVDLRKLNVRSLRERIGIVSQEPVLFAGTIAENIAYGRPDASIEEIKKAAKSANAHTFIQKWKTGYNTQVGERGAKLSGGQKQRIAIARAMMKNPDILLLDEATSALDTRSEKIVQDALNIVAENRTTIIVAHRLATIQNVDRIYVVSDGGIAEEGTYEELYALKGIFRGLVDLQGLGAKGIVESTQASSGGASESGVNKRRDQTDEKEEKAVVADAPPVAWARVFHYNKPELPHFFIGLLGSAILGVTQPMFAIIFGTVIGILFRPNDPNFDADLGFWAGMFLVLAAGMLIGAALQGAFLGVMGEKLTERLRLKMFKSLMRKDPGWFDHEDHNTGLLTSKLAEEVTLIEGMLGGSLGLQLQNVVTVITALVIAFYFGWVLAFIVLGCAPFMALSGAMEIQLAKGLGEKTRKAIDEANRVATEAISQIRTVAAFTHEQVVVDQYDHELAKPQQLGIAVGHNAAFWQALGGLLMFGSVSLIYYCGGVFVSKNGGQAIDSDSPAYDLTFENMNKVLMAIMFMAMLVGQSQSLAPDAKKAKQAAARLFQIVDDEPAVDALSKKGKILKNPKGRVEFDRVEFSYPTRPGTAVLRDVSFAIEPGQTVALVGESGSGKSSCVQLALRYYEVLGGEIRVDGKDIRKLNPHSLRDAIGLVGQEPVLFRGTIKENILYGKPDATDEEVIAACKLSNAHNFISKFQDGYDTQVGERGGKMSGGQKQRIAIARAIIKNPPILLLDEATSALDTDSERKVQEALDKAAEGRATLVIAHRLSTIKDADHIIVLQSGKIVEEGTHDSLMALKSKYYHLVRRQTAQTE